MSGYKKKKSKKQLIKEKEERINLMRAQPRYSADIWHQLKQARIDLYNYKKQENIEKIKETKNLISLLEAKAEYPEKYEREIKIGKDFKRIP